MQTERAYEVLGLAQGASFREVMEAHRDLVQVWDPKRFHDNVRLQRRAIQEMASINEAFDTLRLQALQGQLPHTKAAGPGPNISVAPAEPAANMSASADRRSAAARASLYEDALPRRRKSPFLSWLPLITGLILTIVIVAWILLSDSGSDIDDENAAPPTSAEPAAKPETPQTPASGGSDDLLPRASSNSSTPEAPGNTATQQDSPESLAPLVRRAFRLLQEKSTTASILVEQGRFDNLRFDGWRPLRGDVHEFQLQLLAVREPDEEKVRLIWSVNLDTGEVDPLNEAARELEERESGPKPSLIRKM